MNIRFALAAVAAGTLLAGSAHADDKAMDKAYNQAGKAYDQAGSAMSGINPQCMSDAQKFCKDKMKDDKGDAKTAKKVFDCLDDNKSDLAQSCRDFVDTFAACKKDFDKHCKDQNIFTNNQCLQQKRTDLSEKCRNEYDKYAQNNPQIQGGQADLGVCKREFERYCADVQPGSGQEWSCLATNRVYLSESCRKDLDKRGSGSGASQGTGIGSEPALEGSGSSSGTGMGNEGYGTGSSGSTPEKDKAKDKSHGHENY